MMSSTATGRSGGSPNSAGSAKRRSEAGCKKRAGSAWSAPNRCRQEYARERRRECRGQNERNPSGFAGAQMVQRLLQVLDAKLREIEERMATTAVPMTASPQSAADAERDVR